jgi:hypothetical protein
MPSILTLFLSSLCCICISSHALAQKHLEVVEVIQKLPTPASPTWHIGNEQYEVDDNTEIDTDFKPFAGNLASVTFHERSGQRLASEITPLPFAATDINDGPYIFFNSDERLVSHTMQNGVVQKFELPQMDGTHHMETSIESVPIIEISRTTTNPPSGTYSMPPKLLAISDIEGNLDQLLRFLQFHNVIDKEFNWSWSTNHILFNGDSVDRGDQVTELLWLMRKLQRQAVLAGGNVHVVLGNHEAMILAGDIRYTHSKYKFVAERLGIPYHQFFSKHSILGNWLRAQNCVVQIGPYLFTHAGYGPELNALKFSINEINTSVRNALGPPSWPERTVLAKTLAWHSKGPLWYRGYFEKHSEKYGPKPTNIELNSILARHQAKAIVVGHTVTGAVGWLDGDKRLIGIDVHWDTPGEGQGLMIADGKLTRVTMTESNLELLNIPTAK